MPRGAHVRKLLLLLALFPAAWCAGSPDVSRAAEGQSRALEGRLILTTKAIEPGQRVGLKVRNTGAVEMWFGPGATVERRQGGRWVDVQDEFCPRGCPRPAIGLFAPPGATVGPSYGDLRDTVRFRRTVRQGRYRLTKTVSAANRPRRILKLRAIVRVRVGRLIVIRSSIEPGQRTGLKVRNTGTVRIVFGLGATVERRQEGRWVDVQDEFCPGGCPRPAIGLSAPPGATVGPGYGDLRDTVRFPRSVPSGRYRLTKYVSPTNRPRRTFKLRAIVRVQVGS
jgi:hypothetical protein